jgi:hypothetical protein
MPHTTAVEIGASRLMNTWADNEHPKTNRVNTSVKVRFMTEAFNPQQTYPACEAKTCRNDWLGNLAE